MNLNRLIIIFLFSGLVIASLGESPVVPDPITDDPIENPVNPDDPDNPDPDDPDPDDPDPDDPDPDDPDNPDPDDPDPDDPDPDDPDPDDPDPDDPDPDDPDPDDPDPDDPDPDDPDPDDPDPDDPDDPEPDEDLRKYKDIDRRRCYHDNVEESTVTFIFDNAYWQYPTDVYAVYLRHNCSDTSKIKSYYMRYDEAEQVYTVTLSYDKLRRPGLSGHVDFNFVVNYSTQLLATDHDFVPEEYLFWRRKAKVPHLLVHDGEDLDEIRKIKELAWEAKTLEDFDLTKQQDREDISNFRLVPGTANCYRSYHPFKVYQQSALNSTEIERHRLVVEMADSVGIKSIITFAGRQTPCDYAINIGGQEYWETIPQFYADAMANDDVLYVGETCGGTLSTSTVYFDSDSERFMLCLKEVIDFINDESHKPPYLVHCALGTERTGIYCGFIAALCGASWDEIVEDFERSSRMCIEEYRGGGLLKYSMEQFLSVTNLDEVEDLGNAIRQRILDSETASNDDVDKVVNMLMTEVPGSGDDDNSGGNEVTGVEHIVVNGATGSDGDDCRYIDMQGREVEPMSRGIYIKRIVRSDGSVEIQKVKVD